MKVKLKEGRVYNQVAYDPGAIVDVDPEEVAYLLKTGAAVEPDAKPAK